MHRPLILIGCVFASTAAAEPVQMTGDSIKTTLAGCRLDLDTPVGTTIPIRFSRDGLVAGEAGVMAPVLGAAKDRGRWWTEGDRLCLKWFRWFDAKARCIGLKQDGARIFWTDQSGETGTGTLAERPQVAEKQTPLPTPYALGAVEVPTQRAPKAQAAKEAAKERAVEAAAPKEQAVEMPATAAQTADEQAADTRPALAEAATAEPAASGETQRHDVPRMRFADVAALDALVSVAAAESSAAQSSETGAPAPSPRPVHKSAAQPAPAAKKPKPQETQRAAPQAAKASAAKGTAAKTTVARANPPAAAPAKPSIELFKVAGVVEGDMLNVRSGPSEYHPQVGGIAPQGRGVQIVGPCRDQWCPIRYGRVSGWVNRSYLIAETATVTGSTTVSRSAR